MARDHVEAVTDPVIELEEEANPEGGGT